MMPSCCQDHSPSSVNAEKPLINRGFSWRYRWDLNPRMACTITCFRDMLLRPLGHGTETESNVASAMLSTARVASVAAKELTAHS